MKNIKSFSLALLIITTLVQISGCKKSGANKKPLSEVLRAIFFAQQVKHDNTIVYTKGAASNTVSGYSKFRMDLSSTSSVAFTDFDGTTFNGTYTLSSGSLVLSGLTPQPTGSGGTITFNVVSFQESPAQVVLTRAGSSVKTGNTKNEYTLTTTP